MALLTNVQIVFSFGIDIAVFNIDFTILNILAALIVVAAGATVTYIKNN